MKKPYSPPYNAIAPINLPNEIKDQIYSYLEPNDLYALRESCRFFKKDIDSVLRKFVEGQHIKQIVCDKTLILFLQNNGKVWVLGDTRYAQLGLDAISHEKPTLVPNVSNVKQVTSKQFYTVFILNDGSTWGFGENEYSENSLGHLTTTGKPEPIAALNNVKVKKVCFSENSTYYLTTDGSVYACGDNRQGELGLGNTDRYVEPVLIPNVKEVEDIIVGNSNVFITKKDGSVWAWGSCNEFGALGVGHKHPCMVPTQVIGIEGVRQIYTDLYHTIFVSKNGDLFLSGFNIPAFTLALEQNGTSTIPKKVLDFSKVKKIENSLLKMAVLTEEGKLWYCSKNGPGFDRYGIEIKHPLLIEDLGNVKDIALGTRHMAILNKEGMVYMYGGNINSQLGLDVDNAYDKPVLLTGVESVESIFANSDYTLCQQIDGTLKVWGYPSEEDLESIYDPLLFKTPTEISYFNKWYKISEKLEKNEVCETHHFSRKI